MFQLRDRTLDRLGEFPERPPVSANHAARLRQ